MIEIEKLRFKVMFIELEELVDKEKQEFLQPL
jgi:hypothetical protein